MVKIAFNFFAGFTALSFFATNLTIHVIKNATNLTIHYVIFATFPFFAKKIIGVKTYYFLIFRSIYSHLQL